MIGSRIAGRVVARQTLATTARLSRPMNRNMAISQPIVINSARSMSHSFQGTIRPKVVSNISSASNSKPTVVVLGCGWGGMKFLYKIDKSKYNVVLVAPRDHMLFTPLLAGSAVGTAESRSIVDPVRPLLAKKGFEFFQASAQTVDAARKVVVAKPYYDARYDLDNATVEIPYDYLIVGVGAEPATFGIPGVKENTLFLKEAADGYLIRKRLHDIFEAASLPMKALPADTPSEVVVAATAAYEKEVQRLLTLVIVGGGPTGVEFAGELSDYVRDMKKLYPHLADKITLKLIASSDSIISNFNEELRNYALDYLTQTHGYEVQLNMKVLRVEKDVVVTEKEHVPFGVCVWSTGIAAREFTQNSSLSVTPRKHAITMDSHLRVLNGEGFVFGLGDACTVTVPSPAPLPPIAQVAEQQGAYLAKVFNKGQVRSVTDSVSNLDYLPYRETSLAPKESTEVVVAPFTKTPSKPFQYFSLGMLAYIGKGNALADMMGASSVLGPYQSKNFTEVEAFTQNPKNPVIRVKNPKHFVNDPIHLNVRGLLGFLVWRSAYISKIPNVRTCFKFPIDWVKTFLFGRDNSSINY